jgi:calcineurin-like phosphoesterase family protein
VSRLLLSVGMLVSWLAPPQSTATPVIITAAGDIATGGSGDSQTARLIRAIDPARVLTLGDNAYPDGTLQQFNTYYDPTWGAFKAKTKPSPGNHDYHTPGAAGYFGYFGSRAPAPNYTYVLGQWRIVSLNSATSRGAALEFMRGVLDQDSHLCDLAYFHHPRWSSGVHGNDAGMDPLWDEAVAQGVDVVLTGHDHNYERFARLDENGQQAADGTKEFVVGTGGAPLRDVGPPIRGSQKRIERWGVLRMALRAGSYSWSFRNVANAVLDSGTTGCHA